MTNCGHSIHSDCIRKYQGSGNFRCPICRKCLKDMSRYWANLRMNIAAQPMPPMKIDVGEYVITSSGKFSSAWKFAVHCTQIGLHDDERNLTILFPIFSNN